MALTCVSDVVTGPTCTGFKASDFEPLICVSQVDAAELFKGQDDGVLIADESLRAEAYRKLADMPISVIPRGHAELSEEVAQLVTYDLFVYRDTVLMYCRGEAAEPKLADKLSVGVGGHVSALDLAGTLSDYEFDASLIQARARELTEELGAGLMLSQLDSHRTSQWPMLIYDQSTSLGRVHVGLVHVIGLTRIERDRLNSVHTNLAGAAFVPLADLQPGGSLHDKLESWSRRLMSAYTASQMVPLAARLEWDDETRREQEEEQNLISHAKPCAEMIFEANRSPDPLRYNPHRDVAYCHGPKVLAMVRLLEADSCSDLFHLGLSQSAIAEAVAAYLSYLENVRKYEQHKTANSALMAAGWFALSPNQRLAITSTLGSLYTVMAFQAQREVDSENSKQAQPMNASELSKLCWDSCHKMSRGRWARLWSQFKACVLGIST